MIRIGIDVGGTKTDAVLMDGKTVMAGVKAPTSADVMTGVVQALRDVLRAFGASADTASRTFVLPAPFGPMRQTGR
jgi:N-methylhydantoinase A/oxoprolinase/acetone carboxylase beta subunit